MPDAYAIKRERERQLDEWVQLAVRYFVLANAGAAVATLSFIGTTGAGFPRIAVLALLCFIGGVVLAGLVIFGELTNAYRALLSSTEPHLSGVEAAIQKSWLMRSVEKVGRRADFLAGAFGLFMLGCLIGVGSLLCW
jgi:hypothetical protein